MDAETSDPVEGTDGVAYLYEISTWETRSLLDRLSVAIYWLAVRAGQVLVILAALGILVGIGALGTLSDPVIGLLTSVSVLPALFLAAYVWHRDVTAKEPLTLVAATFLLAVLTAGFAAVLNGVLQPVFSSGGIIGMVRLFYLVVAYFMIYILYELFTWWKDQADTG
jgi:hypothetical protein